MTMDTTGIGIAIGLSFAFIYAIIELVRHKDLNVLNIAIVFLMIFAMVAGGELIFVAMKGNPDNLPATWREYLCASGVIGIGLSTQKLIAVIKKLASSKANSANQSVEPTRITPGDSVNI